MALNDRRVQDWSVVEADNPIALLTRQKVEGHNMLVVMVRLDKGCHVAVHHHESEQFACVISGRVTWTLGEDGEKVEVVGGQIVHLPPHFPHGVDADEDSVILDILAPVGAMGVDSQNQ